MSDNLESVLVTLYAVRVYLGDERLALVSEVGVDAVPEKSPLLIEVEKAIDNLKEEIKK